MKNRGFTLIEILVVIAVIGVIGTIVTVSVSDVLDETKQKRCDEFVRKIEDSACAYSSLTNKSIVCTRANCNPISLNTLIIEGYITETQDACTGRTIDGSKTISISWNSSGEKKCTYNGVRTYER